jgi:hypothetical protein
MFALHYTILHCVVVDCIISILLYFQTTTSPYIQSNITVFQTTIYRIIVVSGGAAEYEKVKATYYATEDNIERKYAMNR